ncbi:unnamed protein product [Symbiodinium natans]|uniref:EGF-like domain-containing protein n=1 Tax=Symbiodinium natans TaxID=878477 RepID=A0A812UI08_9DINO|nr:unnamed protein product [Symbiodinium natans]
MAAAVSFSSCLLAAWVFFPAGEGATAGHALASLSCTQACPVITGTEDPCSDEEWCHNNGVCINDARNANFKTCVCRPGFRGDRCAEVGTAGQNELSFYSWANEIYIFFQADIYSMPHTQVWQNVFDIANISWPLSCAGAEADGLAGSWKLTASGLWAGALCESNTQQLDQGNSITRYTATGTMTAVDPSQAFCANQAESCGGVTTTVSLQDVAAGDLLVVEYNATGQNGAAYQMLFKLQGPDSTYAWLERGLGPASEVVTDATPRVFAVPLDSAGSYTLTASIGVYDYTGGGGSHTAMVDIIGWQLSTSEALQFCDCSSTLDHKLHDHKLHDHKLHDHKLHDRKLQDRKLQDHKLQDHKLQHHKLQHHELQHHELQHHKLQHRIQDHDKLNDHKLRDHQLHEHELQHHGFHDRELVDNDLEDHKVDHPVPNHELHKLHELHELHKLQHHHLNKRNRQHLVTHHDDDVEHRQVVLRVRDATLFSTSGNLEVEHACAGNAPPDGFRQPPGGFKEKRVKEATKPDQDPPRGGTNVRDWRPAELVLVLWAAAALGAEAPAAVLALRKRGWEALSARDLSLVAWSFAATSSSDLGEMEALAAAATPKIHEFDAQGLSNLCWALGCAKVADRALFRQAGRIVARGGRAAYSAQQMANICWSFASLAFFHRPLCEEASSFARENPASLRSEEMSALAWSMATLDFRSVGLAARAQEALAGASSREGSNLAWACAVLGDHREDVLRESAKLLQAEGESAQDLHLGSGIWPTWPTLWRLRRVKVSSSRRRGCRDAGLQLNAGQRRNGQCPPACTAPSPKRCDGSAAPRSLSWTRCW